MQGLSPIAYAYFYLNTLSCRLLYPYATHLHTVTAIHRLLRIVAIVYRASGVKIEE